MAPLIPLLDSSFNHKLLYTGQHYDYSMSEVFFREFALREPDCKLDLVNESNKRLCLMFNGVKDFLEMEKPDLCIVLGDSDSTLIGALAASELRIPVAHVEAGLRSFDTTMPEERNRIVVDHLSTILFAPSELAFKNLECEGINRNVYLTGNPIVDVCLRIKSKASKLNFHEAYGLNPKEYMVVTIHREYNTREEVLHRIFKALIRLNEIQMIAPIHPRTKQKLIEMGFWTHVTKKSHIRLVEPLGYVEFLSLMLNSRMVLTDSGGIQEEAVTLQIPCLTLRDNTERWETIHLGVNRLIGTKPNKILKEVRKAWVDEEWLKKVVEVSNPYGDGHASEKIISKLKAEFAAEEKSSSLIKLREPE